MAKLLVQFHATPEEIVDFVNGCLDELRLNGVLCCEPPCFLIPISERLLLDDILSQKEGAVIRVLLLSWPLLLGATSFGKLLDANDGATIIQIGRLTSEGLEESALSFSSELPEGLVLAKRIASKLKGITTAGVVAFDPVSGAEAKFRTHRYSRGAKVAHDGGVQILPIAGHSLFRLG